MNKQIAIEIVKSSWSNQRQGQNHTFPSELTNYPAEVSIDFLRALLWMGLLSVSARIPRWWMAVRWAQVRYLGMVEDSSPRLCLHSAIEDLDAHQKTVLSDDWGMGLTLEWLDDTFHYALVDHGMSYLKRLERQGKAYFDGPPKRRGPKKCPDFVGLDQNGKLHLIECKGNQQGSKSLIKQLSDGRSQKQNVLFNNESKVVSQRLVAGVAIATAGGRWDSILRIEDPPPEPEQEHYFVTESDPEVLSAELRIGTLARMLMLAGEVPLVQRILPDELGHEEVRSLEFEAPTRFESQSGEWIGRVERTRLPVPLRIEDRLVRWSSIRHGVNPAIVNTLSQSGRAIERQRLASLVTTRIGHGDVPEPIRETPRGKLYSAIQWGDSFISDIELR